MKTSVVITCYNYREYVREAVESVLGQSERPDEIVVIDDGSSDGSGDIAREALVGFDGGRVVAQENAGQLAAFEAGLREATGEWVFFLDADDRYRPDHLERFRKARELHPKGTYFFCRAEAIGDRSHKVWGLPEPYGDFGYSTLLVLAGLCAHGGIQISGVTSTLCIHRSILEDVLPLPVRMHREWKTRADDILMLGAALAGARKIGIDDHAIDYRVHGGNAHAGQSAAALADIGRAGIEARMKGELCRKLGLTSTDLLRGLAAEFAQVPFKTPHLKKQYLRAAVNADLPLDLRIRQWLRIRRTKLQ